MSVRHSSHVVESDAEARGDPQMRRVGGCASHEFEGASHFAFPKPLPPKGPNSPTPRSTFCGLSGTFSRQASFKTPPRFIGRLLGASTAVRQQRARSCTDSAHPYRARRLTPDRDCSSCCHRPKRHSPVTFATWNHNIVTRGRQLLISLSSHSPQPATASTSERHHGALTSKAAESAGPTPKLSGM